MKNNFLSLVANVPQNTGGGNSQTKRATLALPLRYLCAMLLALFMGVGQMWGTCDPGTIFKFEVKDGLTSGNIAKGDPIDLSSYVTVTAGSVSAYGKNDGSLTIVDEKAISIAKKAEAYFIFTLSEGCSLQEGDVIKYIIYNKNALLQPETTTSDAADKLTLTKTSNVTTYGSVVIPAGHALIGESTFYLFTGDNACKIKSVEISRPATITLDATTNGGSVSTTSLKGVIGDKVGLPHAFKTGKKFKGWYTTADGDVKKNDAYTIAGDITLYAQFEDLPVNGEMFSLTMEDDLKPLEQCTIVSTVSKSTHLLSPVELTRYATIYGGSAVLSNSSTSNHAYISNSTASAILNGGNGCLTITLESALQVGDVITTSIASQNIAYTVEATRSTATNFVKGDDQTLTVTSESPLKGKSVIYLWSGSSSGGALKSITITRPAKYNVTYTAGTGSVKAGKELPMQAATLAGGKFNLASGDNLEKDGYDFNGWQWTDNSEVTHDVAAGTEFTMPGYDVTFVAQWVDHVANYTVIYKDGTTELGSETVEVGQHPTGSEIADPTKDCYTFAGWSPALSGVSGSDGDEVVVNATWTANYFTESVDFEEGGASAVSGIASKNIVASAAGEYDGGKESENWAYKGWKIKSNGATVKVLVQANKKLTYKFGYLDATAHVNITNDNITREVTGASKEEGNPLKYTTFSHIKDYDAVYTFTTGSSGAAVIKALSVEAVYTAYFEDEMDVVTTTVVGNVTEVELPTPSVTTKSGKNFIGWKANNAVTVDDVVVAANTLIAAGKIAVLSDNTTFTTQWVAPENFDVKFFQGYGEPDVQIGETKSISTGGHAVAPADPTRTGFVFLGWSYDATEAHIVDVATYGITTATNFTAMWKAVWTVTFDGTGAVNVENGETVASPDSPTQAGKVFQGWYNGESKYDFSSAVAGNLALTSKWADADANHYVYAYNDDFHFDGVVYKTPEGKTTDPDASEATLNMTTPYTLFSGAEGITSIVATKAVYDYKKADNTKHITAYLKLKKSSDDANSKLIFTIASGYTAVLKVKMGGYSKTPTVTLKKGDDAVTGTPAAVSGKAEDKDYAEITYNLVAGVYEMTTADQTLYFSHIDLQATALPTHTVTYKAGEGTGDDVEDADATNVADVPSTFTAPTGKVFNGWKDESDNDVEVGTIVSSDMTLTAQWIAVYAVTFNMNGHGDAIDPQDIKHGAKATKPDDPIAIGFDFGGWFTDEECTAGNEFDFNTSITAATPLYAKWTADPCPDSEKKSIVKAVMTSTSTATVTGYNDNEYAGGYIINNLADGDNAFAYDFGEGSVTGYKLKGSGSAIFATLAKGGFEAGDKVVFAVTKKAGDNKLAVYAAKDKNNVLKLAEIDVADAGIYEYKLKAADIAAIEAAGADYKSIGSYRGDYNPFIYSVELKGCRSWAVMHTLTFKNIDGTATIAAEPLEEGAYASTVAPAAPKIALKRFKGWSESIGGTTVDLTSYTITGDKTLYAVYEDIVCPTTGTVYKFEIKDELPSENLPTSTDKDMSSYITATGDGYLTYTATANNKATINSDGTIQMKDASAAYLKVELECALAAGDQIRAHVTNNPIRVQVGTTYDSNKDLILAKNAYEFVAITSAMEGKQVLYITRSSNGNANLADFEIYRPAKYDVSFNMMGHGSAIADLEDVVEGSKITAPSPAPTDADYSFAGWYKENTLENEWKFDVDVVETNTTLYAKWLDKSDATLKSLMYGSTEIELQAGVYEYNVELPSLTSSVPALTAETNNPNATKLIANGTFDGAGNATSTVTVTPEVGANKVYTVNFARGIALEQVTVTTSMEWDWSAAGVTAEINNTNTPGLSGNDVVIANVPGVKNDADFNSQALKASGTNAIRTTYFQGKELNIKTDKEGMLIVDFSGTNNKARVLKIYDNADNEIAAWNYNSETRQVQQVIVPAGKVTLKAFEGENGNNARIYNLKFYALAYTRDDDWMAPGELGTVCYPEGLVAVGAEMYKMAGVDDNNKFVFDEVSVLDPGKPYLFVAQSNVLKFYATTATAAGAAGTNNGMVGTFASIDLSHTDARAAKWYYFSGKKFYSVSKRTSDLNVPANRAYVDMNTPVLAGAPKHGVRRITFDVQGTNIATGIENAAATDKPAKMLINGQLFILRGEKMYDAKGQLVK